MVRIGKRAPCFRVPAVITGHLTYLALGQFKSRWVFLCFPPRLTPEEAAFLDRQTALGSLAENDACLIAVGQDESVLHESWARHAACRLIMLVDPLGRLRRAFGISTPHRPGDAKASSSILRASFSF